MAGDGSGLKLTVPTATFSDGVNIDGHLFVEGVDIVEQLQQQSVTTPQTFTTTEQLQEGPTSGPSRRRPSRKRPWPKRT
jgi:hypothetical protein